MEATTRSPIFNHLSSSLNGIGIIRACRNEDMLVSEFDQILNLHTSTWFTKLAITRWLASSLDWVTWEFGNSATALVLTSLMTILMRLQWFMENTVFVENMMTSVERIVEYGTLKSEAYLDTAHGQASVNATISGPLQFDRVWLKYAQDEKYVLKDISFTVKENEKIGVVGRTGAGKSSLITALFRLAEPEGSIHIGGKNILQLPLHIVRKSLSIIPQDPTMFACTLRENLDPFGEYSDKDIWRSLEQVEMDKASCITAQGLDTKVAENGSNFSVGESQLLCLARTILRQNKIIIMDEATANVDHRTDAQIQKTIKQSFAQCTIITIAHRLHTIMDSDRVMVLSAGELVEMDTPHNLLQNLDSHLSKLAKNAGESAYHELKEMAASNASKRKQL